MFLARIVFFRLHESPRYLVHAGRPQEAVEALQMISKFNGSELEIELDDVADHHPADPQRLRLPSSPPSTSIPSPTSESALSSLTSDSPTNPKAMNIQREVDETTTFDAGDIEGAESRSGSGRSSPTSAGRAPLVTRYDSIGQTSVKILEGHSFKTPPNLYPPPPQISSTSSSETVTSSKGEDVNKEEDRDQEGEQKRSEGFDMPNASACPRHIWQEASISSSMRRSVLSTASRNSSIFEMERTCQLLPMPMRKPLALWWDRVSIVLEPEWFRTTILVWATWFSMSLGMSYPLYLSPSCVDMALHQHSRCLMYFYRNCWRWVVVVRNMSRLWKRICGM